MNLWKVVAEHESFNQFEDGMSDFLSRHPSWVVRNFRLNIVPEIRKILRKSVPYATNYRITRKSQIEYIVSYDIGKRRFTCNYQMFEKAIIRKNIIDI